MSSEIQLLRSTASSPVSRVSPCAAVVHWSRFLWENAIRQRARQAASRVTTACWAVMTVPSSACPSSSKTRGSVRAK